MFVNSVLVPSLAASLHLTTADRKLLVDPVEGTVHNYACAGRHLFGRLGQNNKAIQ